MEPKPESLWWTSTHKFEDVSTLRVGSRGIALNLSFREVFEVLRYRYHWDWKGFQGAERTMCKGMVSWWRDKTIDRSRTVSMETECRRVHSHVYSTSSSGSIIWPRSGGMINNVRAWEAKKLLLTLRPRMKTEETWVGYRTRTANLLRKKCQKKR